MGSKDEIVLGSHENSRGVQGKLVLGEGTSLVGAEDGHTSQLLDGSQAGHDGLVVSEVAGTHRHGCCGNHLHGDRDGSDQQNESLHQGSGPVSRLRSHTHDEQNHHKHDPHSHQEVGDLQQHHLQVTAGINRADKSSGLAKECVETSSVHGSVKLPTLDDGTGVHDITREAGHREGLSSESSLIDFHWLSLVQLRVRRNNVTELENY